MQLIIDASNIKAGGGLTHLRELLSTEGPVKAGFREVFLWAPDATLEKIPAADWLVKCPHPWLNGHYVQLWRWKKQVLPQFVREKQALLFIPGTGSSPLPYVTMCRNLLPLDIREMNRYFFSSAWLRLRLLRRLHLAAYRKAAGVIFLNEYCRKVVPQKIQRAMKQTAIIAHGLNPRFFRVPENSVHQPFSLSNPFRLLYVSIINVYKHQWQVAEAVFQLRQEGFHLQLDLIGPAYAPALRHLEKVLGQYSPAAGVTYHGKAPYEQVHQFYQQADAFIFASTCETYGMVLTEAMAAGLPVACSNHSSMPETAGDAAVYFDPLVIDSIKAAIVRLYQDGGLREELSQKSLEKARSLSWEKCAGETFAFLAEVNRKAYPHRLAAWSADAQGNPPQAP
jgi:glycosyltransferase involved in cell wall biosynthesis